MSEPYIGEIRMFAGTYAPRNWALCDGQIMAVTQNDALFSLIGSLYGGDGRTTFGLPDMRGRIPVNFGTGNGLTPYPLAQKFGTEAVRLSTSQIPSHIHPLQASNNDVSTPYPQGAVLGKTGAEFYHTYESGRVSQLAANSVGSNGGDISHSNLMPALCVNFIIALKGIYPPRN